MEIPRAYPELLEARKLERVRLRDCVYLKKEVPEYPDFSVRAYQSIGIVHLLKMTRFVLGDDAGLGKTLQAIYFFCYLLEKDPKKKLLWLGPKSSLLQIQGEFKIFTEGVKTQVIRGGNRAKQYEEFQSENKQVMIINYHLLHRDYSIVLDVLKENFVVVFDECTAFKDYKTKTFAVCKEVADKADRVVGMSATIIKNRLMEAYSIFRLIAPGIFPRVTKFRETYCIEKLIKIPGKKGWYSKRRIPIVIGYKNLKQFREKIDPFFLGRRADDVSDELPKVIFKDVKVPMSDIQFRKYKEALIGFLELGSGEVKEVDKFTNLIYCQQIVNSPELIGVPGRSTKEEELFRLLEEEFIGEKVVIYTFFRKWINRLERLMKERDERVDRNSKIKQRWNALRITGAENDKVREDNKNKFLNDDKYSVILINEAGSQSINLHSGRILIFLDLPWSFGDLVQDIGRIRRMGSKYDKILVVNMLSAFPVKSRAKAIDERKIVKLKSKRDLSNLLFGEIVKDVLESREDIVRELYRELLEDARSFKR